MRLLIYSTAIALLTAPALQAQTAEVVGQFDWMSRSIVGVSGLEVSDDGNSFVAVSDQGWLLQGQFAREGGTITDVTLESLQPLLGIDGLPTAARRIGDWADAEGLAIDESGRQWVSFERWARVSTHDENERQTGRLLPLPKRRERGLLRFIVMMVSLGGSRAACLRQNAIPSSVQILTGQGGCIC